jgi:hypothetical protein
MISFLSRLFHCLRRDSYKTEIKAPKEKYNERYENRQNRKHRDQFVNTGRVVKEKFRENDLE